VLALLASAAEEGARIVIGMLIVGLLFVVVILLGDGLHWVQSRRERERASRPL
jgi:hypothetical protein